jgi:hypothetical protein
MKTIIAFLLFTIIFTFPFSLRADSDHEPGKSYPYNAISLNVAALSAKFELKEEAYINDIPFDTKRIFVEANDELGCHVIYGYSPLLEEEKYIDDIPFNSYDIASNTNYGFFVINPALRNFNVGEEAYIDDIPFDTESIYKSFDSLDSFTEKNDKNYLIESFDLQDEGYIDDIPWDTKQMFAEYLKYPENARKFQIEGSVAVSFSYNERGYIEVDEASSNSDELKNYVVGILEEIRLTKGIVEVGKDYYARFDFKLH